MAFAGNEHIFGLMPAGQLKQFLAQQIDSLSGLGRQRYRHPILRFLAFRAAASKVDLVFYGDAASGVRQAIQDRTLCIAKPVLRIGQ